MGDNTMTIIVQIVLSAIVGLVAHSFIKGAMRLGWTDIAIRQCVLYYVTSFAFLMVAFEYHQYDDIVRICVTTQLFLILIPTLSMSIFDSLIERATK